MSWAGSLISWPDWERMSSGQWRDEPGPVTGAWDPGLLRVIMIQGELVRWPLFKAVSFKNRFKFYFICTVRHVGS